MINATCENEEIRSKSQRRIPSENWIVNPNSHEAIVNEKLYDIANNAIRKVSKNKQPRNKDTKDRVFYCAHCGMSNLDHYEKYRSGMLDKSDFLTLKTKLANKKEYLALQLEAEKQKLDNIREQKKRDLMIEESVKNLQYDDEFLKSRMYLDIKKVIVYDHHSIKIYWRLNDLFADIS